MFLRREMENEVKNSINLFYTRLLLVTSNHYISNVHSFIYMHSTQGQGLDCVAKILWQLPKKKGTEKINQK